MKGRWQNPWKDFEVAEEHGSSDNLFWLRLLELREERLAVSSGHADVSHQLVVHRYTEVFQACQEADDYVY